MKLLAALFAPHALISPYAAPAAIVAPQTLERPAVVTRSAQAAARLQIDPLGEAAAALERALASGYSAREAAAATLEALALAEFDPLELNGPHTTAGERVSKKQLKKFRLQLRRVAAWGFVF